MTLPPAWPEADEDSYGGGPGSRSKLIEDIQKELGNHRYQWDTTTTGVYEVATWSGNAAGTAKGRTESHSSDMQSVDQLLTKAKTFYLNAHTTIVNAKNRIIEICNHYQAEIDRLSNADFKNESDRTTAIDAQVQAAFNENSEVVQAAASAVKTGGVYTPQEPARRRDPVVQLLSGQMLNTPPPAASTADSGGTVESSGATGALPAVQAAATTDAGGTTGSSGATGPLPAVQAAATTDAGGTIPSSGATGGPLPAPVPSGTTQANGTIQSALPPAGVVTPPPPPAPPPAIPKTGTPPPVSVGSGSGSGGGGSIGAGSGGAGGPGAGGSSSGGSASPLSDAKTGDQKAEAGPGQDLAGQTPDDLARLAAPAAQPAVAPAAFSAPALSAPLAPPIDPASIASAAINHTSAAVPDGPGPPSGPGGGGSGGGGGPIPPGGGGGGGIAPPVNSMPAVPPMPLLPPATPPPAGPPPPPPPSPNVNSAANKPPDVLPAPIPVSAVRAERDAILAASAAGTMAAGGANAALTLARRIAAALNVGATDFGFFWITGLTADGTIVVANSYGLGYIPQGVNLPENVKLATADESIPMADRAKWATYPILAVQGWAQAHAQKLRAVIATETQFANFDPGAAKIVLQAEDIPDTGAMQGRSRLEVIAPGAAAHLAAVPDAGLNDLLPAAPADASAPEDRSAAMWFDMAVPLMSTTSDRGIVHMELMVQYADHAQELALYRAHTAADAALQRDAIADWVYWQHLSVLMSDAIDATARV